MSDDEVVHFLGCPEIVRAMEELEREIEILLNDLERDVKLLVEYGRQIKQGNGSDQST